MLKKLLLAIFVALFLNNTAEAIEVTAPVGDRCSDMFNYKGEVYVCADHPVYGKELHRINGGRYSTVVVKDIDPGPGGSGPRAMFESNGWLFFFAETTATGYALWRTDGTEAGTKLIRPIFGYKADRVVANIGSDFFVVVTEDGKFYEGDLIRTDGTYEGTELILADVNPRTVAGGFFGPSTYASTYIPFGGVLYFVTDDSLYKLIGNSKASTVYEELPIDPEVSEIFVSITDDLFKGKMVMRVGPEIWLSDGTTNGTTRFIQGSEGKVRAPQVINGRLLYIDELDFPKGNALRATDEILDIEIWSTIDGTYLGVGNAIGNRLVYRANRELVFTGGSVNTTKSVNYTGGGVSYAGFFYQRDGRKIFKINPVTASKQQLVERNEDIFLADVNFHGVMYTTCMSSCDKSLLWLLNANGSSTKLGSIGSKNHRIHTEGGRSFYSYDRYRDRFNGIWHTNGTPASTYRLDYRYDNGEPEKEPLDNVFIAPIYDLLMNEEDTN